MRNVQQLSRRLAVLVALAGTLACSLTAPGGDDNTPAPQSVAMGNELTAELAAPLDGAVYLEGVPVNVVARVANAGSDIDRVEVLADNRIVTTVPAPNPAGAPSFSVAQSWTPSAPGTYQVSLAVFRGDGSSASAQQRTIEVIASESSGDDSATDDTAPTEPQPTEPEPTAVTAPTDAPADSGGEAGESGESGDTEQPDEAQPPAEDPPTQPPAEEPTDAPPPTESSPTARLTAGANIRGGPGTTFPIIGTYAAGTETGALAVNSAGTWYKIEFYNGEGWIFGNLVEVSGADQLPIDDGPPPPPPTNTPVPATATPEPSNVNLTFNGSITIDPFPPNCGDTMSFRIPIRNTGTDSFGTTGAVVIRDVHIDSGAVTETRAPVPDLPGGGEATIDGVFLTVETNFDTRHRIEVVLDANNEIAESNENDNSFSGNEYTLNNEGGC